MGGFIFGAGAWVEWRASPLFGGCGGRGVATCTPAAKPRENEGGKPTMLLCGCCYNADFTMTLPLCIVLVASILPRTCSMVEGRGIGLNCPNFVMAGAALILTNESDRPLFPSLSYPKSPGETTSAVGKVIK